MSKNKKQVLPLIGMGIFILFLLQIPNKNKKIEMLTGEMKTLKNNQIELEKERDIYYSLFRLMYFQTINNQNNEQKFKFLKTYIKSNNNKYNDIYVSELANTILTACDDNGYDWITIVALIDMESDFNSYAKSSKNARGLCQIIFRYWKKYVPYEHQDNPDILFDPYVNITVAGKILEELHSKFDTTKDVFDYYSGGHTNYYPRLKQIKYRLIEDFNIFKRKDKWKKQNL